MPVIAIDLGATKTAAAVFNEQGDLLFSEIHQLKKRKGKEVGALLQQQIISLLNKTTEKKISITAIGICVPGIAYAKTGKVWCPNIPEWDDYPLLEELHNFFPDKKIKIDSDRACYILGEVWKGNAKNCSDAIFLAVGTGIGAGILMNNQILRGCNDIAGAIGWMGLDRPFHEKYISCGCFEYNASGEGIAKVAKEMISAGKFKESELSKINVDQISARNVFDAFDKNDPFAKKVIENAIECWGMAVANLVSLFNPEKIIFGGGVFGPALKYLYAIQEEAKKWAQPISIKHVTLEGSALGTEAGLYGAAWLAMKD
ncbi:MAG: ROK family protein [Bacteroidetes bacterium]|nr:ROK family protein [Bacteroidota bacterium]MBS1929750.1 ROK family protein [Bacteroidota bacterium]